MLPPFKNEGEIEFLHTVAPCVVAMPALSHTQTGATALFSSPRNARRQRINKFCWDMKENGTAKVSYLLTCVDIMLSGHMRFHTVKNHHMHTVMVIISFTRALSKRLCCIGGLRKRGTMRGTLIMHDTCNINRSIDD